MEPTKKWPRYLTVNEMATYLRVAKTTVYRLAARRQLPGAFRIGGSWRFDLDRFIAEVERKKS
jgi:excisionase family DNA binding protein